MPFIYENYDNYSKNGIKNFKENIPDYIVKNLKYPLRPYQQEAIGRYLFYKTAPNRVLYSVKIKNSGSPVSMYN